MDNYIQELKLNLRKEGDGYRLKSSPRLLDILSIIFEFKIVTGRQLARFLEQREDSKYLYLKLRRMWRAGLLESFKVYAGARFGMPVYYLLSKKGFDVLAASDRYGDEAFMNYPNQKILLNPTYFQHDAMAVELASLEAKNNSDRLTISFQGETGVSSLDFRSGKNIEVFTPDYSVKYSFGNDARVVFTEYERTRKAKHVMIEKLDRYVRHLSFAEREHSAIRFIFETVGMERAFWNTIIEYNPSLLQRLTIFTTNIGSLSDHRHFLEPIYVSGKSIQMRKENKLAVDLSNRVKLIPFL